MKQEIRERIEKIRTGEVPEGYRKTKVGIIPVEWDVKKLGDSCAKITDGTHDTPKPVEDGIPFITAIHVKDNNIDFENCLYLPNTVHKIIYRRCNPEKNDVLLVNIGAGVATTALVNVDYEFSLKNVALLKPDKKRLIGSYLNYYQLLNKNKITNILLNGGAQPFLSLKQISDIPIALPTLPEQYKIADILSTWDKVIKLKEKLITEKKEFKRGLMQKLLTGEIRFPEFTDDWNEIPFNQIFDFEGGFTAYRNDLGNKGIAYLHYGDIHKSNKNFIDVKKELTKIPKINLDIDKVPKKNLLKDGYIVFADASEDCEGIGKSITIFNPEEIPFINDLHTIVGIPKNRTLNKNYSRFFLFEQSIRKQRMFYAQGISVFGISQVNLQKIVAHLPFEPEQEKIAEILTTWETAIELKEKELNQLKEQKRGLMQLLLTGIVRVEVD